MIDLEICGYTFLRKNVSNASLSYITIFYFNNVAFIIKKNWTSFHKCYAKLLVIGGEGQNFEWQKLEWPKYLNSKLTSV